VKYRVLYIPEQHKVLLHPVPECHHTRNKFWTRSYNIFDDIEKALSEARNILDRDEKQSKKLYSMGCSVRNFMKAEHWRRNSDAAVGRRILARNMSLCASGIDGGTAQVSP